MKKDYFYTPVKAFFTYRIIKCDDMNMIKRLLRNSLLVAGLTIIAFTAQAQNGSYIANHRAMAIVLSRTYGIPASLILAVAAIESSGGKGPAAKVLNNHFGIEGKNNYITKKGFKSRYKQYANVFASYLDFCTLMSHKHFYHRLKNNTDCVAWVKAMSRAHYSEVPDEWEQKVLAMLTNIKMQSKKDMPHLLAIK
jgi:Bax protein